MNTDVTSANPQKKCSRRITKNMPIPVSVADREHGDSLVSVLGLLWTSGLDGTQGWEPTLTLNGNERPNYGTGTW